MTEKSLSEINETRASLYWWFATLLTKELDKEQLALYFCGEGVKLLDQLEQEPGFTAPVKKVKSALTAILAMRKPELELAADFSQVFLTDTKAGAPPYASVYLSESGQLFEQPHQDMLELLKAKGLVVDPEFKEPADHIAIQLDYLGNLIIQDGNSVSKAQIEFIDAHILSWLDLFVKATAKVKNSGFYQGICQLLQAYIKQDIAAIKA